jgi:hypothetical protein
MVDASTDRVGVGVQTPTQKLDVYGNLAISGGFLVMSQTVQSISGTGALVANVSSAQTNITTTGAATISLADGIQGQIKQFVMITDGGDAVLTPSNRGGFSSITFNDVGDTVKLQFSNSKWYIIGYYGVAISA